MDDLSLRLDRLRVKSSASPAMLTPSKSRFRSPSVDDTFTNSQLRNNRTNGKITHLPPNPDIVATARAALNAERSSAILKRALLSVRPTPLVNTSACGTPGRSQPISDLQLAFAAGPITGDRLPRPRRPPPPPKPVIVAPQTSSPSTPSWALPSPSTTPSWTLPTPTPPLQGFPAFKAPTSIVFSSPVVASIPVSPGSGRSSLQRQARSHGSAVQLRSSPTATETLKAPASSFDWGVPPPLAFQAAKTTPNNFISLAGGSPSPSPVPAARAPPINPSQDEEDEEEDGSEEYDEEDEEWSEGSEEGALTTIEEEE